MTERKSKGGSICDIEATIICERDSHKGIIIGKGGQMLRRIGSQARRDIEDMLEEKSISSSGSKSRKTGETVTS